MLSATLAIHGSSSVSVAGGSACRAPNCDATRWFPVIFLKEASLCTSLGLHPAPGFYIQLRVNIRADICLITSLYGKQTYKPVLELDRLSLDLFPLM